MICFESLSVHKKYRLRLFALIFLSVVALVAAAPPAYALLPSTATVVSSDNPSSFGGSVSFTATVSGVGLTPTGTVTFMDGTTTLGTAPLNSGAASFSTTTLATGSHSITAVYGGDTVYDASTSAVLTQNVVANSTSTSVTSSANPSALEQSVIFTATVTSSGGTPTGTVTFMDGSTTLGTETLDGSGQATFSTTVLTPGNHSITANYSGDANFSASSSPTLTQTVNLGTSSTAVTSSANPSSFGQTVTFTATVSGLVIEPTGTVTFMDGATTLGTGNLNASGQATFTTPALAVGSHSITAVYGGDSYYNSSTSNLLIQTVDQNASTTAVSSSSNPSAQGTSVTFTATVSGAGATPTGTVTFMDGSTTLGTGALNGSGQAAYSTSSLAVGAHPITAVYGGDSNYSGSTSPVLTQTVTANSSTTAIASSIDPSTFGQSVTFTATVTGSDGGTPTGTVTFKDGATTLGSATLSGGQATFTTGALAAGSHSITAAYSGDANFASSLSPVLTQTVNQTSSTTAVTSSANPSAYGAPVTFTATVSGTAGTPTGTVTFKDGATTLGSGTLNGSGQATFQTSALAPGSHSITANYGGDGNFSASSSPVLTQIVNLGASSTAVSSSANPSAQGASVTFTATVTGAGASPTGTVTFKDGATTLGSGTLSGGQATYSTSALAIGAHSITAVYGGDSNYSGSTSPVLTQNVVANSSTTALASSMNPSTFGQSVTFTATVTGSGGTPTGTVTFKDGTTTLGAATLNGSGQAAFSTTALTAGSHSITASYSGDGNYAASTSSVLTQTVNQSSSSTGLTSSANPSTYGSAVTFTATVSGTGGTPTGTVTFKDGGTTLGTGTLNGSGQAVFSTGSLAVGTHPITAVYGGDSNYSASTSATLTQTVVANSSTTAIASSINPSAVGQAVTFTATVTGSGGTPTGSVTFKDGATTLGTAALNGGGQAAFSTATLAGGSHSITATYSGDGNFGSSVSPVLTQTVGQASSSGTSISSSADPSSYGATVTFTAVVSGTGGTPTGTVTFKDGTTTLGSGTLNGNGQAALSVNSLTVGAHAITASYGGDGNFPASTSPVLTQTVNQNAAAISLASSANPSALGQSVTFTATVTGSGGTPSGSVTFKDGGTVIGTATLAGSSASLTISSLTEGTHSIVAVYGGDGNFTGVTSAALTQSVDTPADSIKLRELQVAATQVAAQASGQAIAGSIASAIADGFSDRCAPLVPSAAGVRVTFCPDRDNSKIVNGDFAALHEASASPPESWLVWADIRGTQLTTSGTNTSLSGGQVNSLIGMTYRFTPDVIIGALGGYEFFDYTSESLDGRLQGEGWTAGGYFGWRFLPGVRFEAGMTRSGIDFDGVAGTASGSFPGNRTLVTAAVVGTYRASKSLEIEPSVRVYDLWEEEKAYIDSLGTSQAERTFSTGRASAGAKAVYYWREFEDLTLVPYIGVYADYYFSNDSADPTQPTPWPLLDGVSARVVSGVTLKSAYGAQFTIGGELGGIAGNFAMWTVRAGASVPF